MSAESLKFTGQQKFLDDHRGQLLHCDAQCRELEHQRRDLLHQLFARSHDAARDDLWPVARIIHRVGPHENLACIFIVCADGTSLAPADVQPVPVDLFNNLWMHAVRSEFSLRAKTSEPDALAWHAKHARCFFAKPGATVAEILDEVGQLHSQMESRVLGQLLWLQADAVCFLPEPGKPNAGWSDAYAFLWAFQQLPPAIHAQLNPCQLLIARLGDK